MNISHPDFEILRELPIIERLNIDVVYAFSYGYQTSEGKYIVYEDSDVLSDTSFKYFRSSYPDDLLLTFVAQGSHLTHEGLRKFGKALNKFPLRFLEAALSSYVEVKILPGSYPNDICHFPLDIDRWIAALRNNLDSWDGAQERGDLLQGVYRDGNMVILAFDSYNIDSLDGVRISAATLLEQLESMKKIFEVTILLFLMR